MLFGMSDALVAEVDHLVAEQRMLDLGELRVGDGCNVHAANLGAHGGCERQRSDVPVSLRMIIELAMRMQ
jgi:hypothetical protein